MHEQELHDLAVTERRGLLAGDEAARQSDVAHLVGVDPSAVVGDGDDDIGTDGFGLESSVASRGLAPRSEGCSIP